MAKITQYSRISHHTLSGSASATFSIPPSEDFTDGSWNINGTELALSEIGVNEDAEKAYIRTGNSIKEFAFVGATSTSGLLFYSEVLSPAEATISITASGSTNSIQLTDTTTEIGYVNDSDEWFSKLQIDGSSPVLNLITGYNNGNLIGRVSTAPGSVTNYVGPNSVSGTYSSVSQTENSWRVLHVENNVEKSDIKVGKDIDNNYRVSVNRTNFAYGTVSTTTSASASVFSLSLPDAGDHSWVKAQVKAITSTFSKSYVADIFGGFRNDGSLNLIGSGYSVIEYTDFTGGARADYDISGTNMLIKVYGETSSTINWSVNVTWG
jgi:hypothetical protein